MCTGQPVLLWALKLPLKPGSKVCFCKGLHSAVPQIRPVLELAKWHRKGVISERGNCRCLDLWSQYTVDRPFQYLWLQVYSQHKLQQTERGECHPRACQPSREEVKVLVIVSFAEAPEKTACSQISCPLLLFVCSGYDGQRPCYFQLQTAAFQRFHWDSRSIHPSVCQSEHHLVNIKILSEVLMPSGYLSRLSHAFIYKLNEFCAGRDLIRLSHLVFFFFFCFSSKCWFNLHISP